MIAIASALLWVAGASAQTAPRVELIVHECPDSTLDFAAMARLVAVELVTDGVGEVDVVDAASPESVSVISIETDCSTASFTVTLDDRLTRKSVVRTFHLDDVPQASRARTAALKIAELLRASWLEIPFLEERAPEIPEIVGRRVVARLRSHVASLDPPPLASSAEQEDAPEPVGWAGLSFFVRAYASGGLALYGPSASLVYRVAGPLALRIDAELAYGEAFHSSGTLEAWSAGGSAIALLAFTMSSLEIAVRAGVGLSWTRMSGAPHGTGVVGIQSDGALVTASFGVDLRVPVDAVLFVLVGIEGGVAIVGARALADDAAVGGTIGASIGARVGVGLSF